MKIFIMGNSCTGKTFLAQKLSIKIPMLSLDSIFWNEDFSIRNNQEEAEQKLKDFLKNHDEWVIEGVYISLNHILLSQCDILIYMDVSKKDVIKNSQIRMLSKDDLDYVLSYYNKYREKNGIEIHSSEKHMEIFQNFKGNKFKLSNKKDIKNLFKVLHNEELT